MPRNRQLRRSFLRLVLFSLAGWALIALTRARRPEPVPAVVRAEEETQSVPGWAPGPAPTPAERETRSGRELSPYRVAASLAFATLFFAGASLSAFGGDQAVTLLEGDAAAGEATTSTSADEGAAAEGIGRGNV